MINSCTTKTPLDCGKKSINEFFSSNEKVISTITLMSKKTLNYYSDEYVFPCQNKFFHLFKHKVYLCTKGKKNQIHIELATTFDVVSVKECTLVYNDKSGKKPLKYYLVTFKSATGKIEKDVEIANNSKSDYKQFQTVLNEIANGFLINMTEQEYKAYVEQFISPKVAEKVTIYSNAGKISDNEILYENALATSDETIWADEDGYIKVSDNSYVKLNKANHYLPKLHKSNKNGAQIANELMLNIKETWSDNIVPALLTLGHMVMSFYYEDFVKRYGVPTLILYGDSGSGKSTLMVVGLSLFGLSKEGLTSGGSTTKSNEFFTSHYNGFNIGIDDVKGDTLKSQNFIALIKGAYKGIARTRMLPYGRGVEYIQFCSPLSYSTNESLPDLKEVINRLNVIEIFGNKFKADEFLYHEFNKDNSNNLQELSLILPEFLKFDKETIIALYEQAFETLEANVEDTQKRIINNVAYAYCGVLLLSLISEVEFENFEEQVIEFAKNQVKQYDSIKTPIEKVLSAIVTLTDLKQLELGTHFKIVDVEVNGIFETHIRFNKDVVLSTINKYYSYDRSMKIDSDSFLRYAKNHNRFRGNNHAVRYDNSKDKVTSSICFNISGMEDFVHIAPHGVMPVDTPAIKSVSADEFRANLKKAGNNM